MIESPGLALAFAAGFVSPCCLPLVPGYLATVCGKPVGEARVDRAAIARSLVFVSHRHQHQRRRGVLVYTNELFRLNVEVQQLLDRFGLNFFQSI